jgi:Tfp pilus assembly protein PilF
MATLTSLVEAHPRAPEAPLAAFTLARLHERAGRTDEAARWYRRALALGLAEPLAESARHALEAREPAQ